MRLFIRSRRTPYIRHEVISFNPETQRAVLRYEGTDYEVEFPTTPEAVRKRKENCIMETEDDDA